MTEKNPPNDEARLRQKNEELRREVDESREHIRKMTFLVVDFVQALEPLVQTKYEERIRSELNKFMRRFPNG
jgi:hypothetical protein